MDIQRQLAAAAVLKAHKRNGTTPPPSVAGNTAPVKKTPIQTGADPKESAKAKNAAAAALAARLGGGGASRASPTSADGAGSAASEESLEKYRKMVKMRVPPPAIRQKMQGEGIPPHIIQQVLSGDGGGSGGGGSRPSSANGVPKHLQDMIMQRTESSGNGGSSAEPLSPQDEKVASQYRKMLKMGIPEGAIINKMTSDGVAKHIQDSVLAGEPAGAASASRSVGTGGGRASQLSPEDEKVASQYRKMMKFGMPEGAVVHKMSSDGIPKHIQDAVLQGEESSGSGAGTSSSSSGRPASGGGGPISKLSPSDEAIATQYRKMLKIGMPEGAIIHKMTQDGVPKHIQESVLANESPAPAGSSSAGNNAGASGSGGGGPPSRLSPQEESIATQYRKMIKMGLPDGAIQHKMSMEGVAQNIQDSVMAREVPGTAPETPVANGGIGGIGANAFAAGAASLKKATPKKSDATPPTKSLSAGSALAMAAAAAASLRGKGPKKMRDVPQNPIPQKHSSAGPEAMAAAAAAAAARRASRQNGNDMKQFEKPPPIKVNAEPKQMVALKSRSPAPVTAPSPPRPPVASTIFQSRSPSRTAASASTPAPSPAAPQARASTSTSYQSPSTVPSATLQSESPGRGQAPVPARPPKASETCTQASASPQPSPSFPVPTQAPAPSPASSMKRTDAFAATSPTMHTLKADEEEVAEYYREMVRSGQSLKSVVDVMKSDCAPENIQDAVISTFAEPPAGPPSAPAPPTKFTVTESNSAVLPVEIDREIDELEAEVVEHYCDLVQKGQSIEDVIQLMNEDGAPPKIQDAVVSNLKSSFSGELSTSKTVDANVMLSVSTTGAQPTHSDTAAVTTPVPAPPAVTTPAPSPAAVTTPAPAPAAVTTPAPASAAVTTPAPAPAVMATPAPSPAAVTIPAPAPAAVTTPAPAPAVMATPAPSPAAVTTPAPAPAAVSTPAPAPAVMATPAPVPAAVSTSAPIPAATTTPGPEPKPVPPPRAAPPAQSAPTGKPPTLLEEPKPQASKAAASPAPTAPKTSAKKKKKPKKKTAKGTTLLDDGAEQHCACTIM